SIPLQGEETIDEDARPGGQRGGRRGRGDDGGRRSRRAELGDRILQSADLLRQVDVLLRGRRIDLTELRQEVEPGASEVEAIGGSCQLALERRTCGGRRRAHPLAKPRDALLLARDAGAELRDTRSAVRLGGRVRALALVDTFDQGRPCSRRVEGALDHALR